MRGNRAQRDGRRGRGHLLPGDLLPGGAVATWKKRSLEDSVRGRVGPWKTGSWYDSGRMRLGPGATRARCDSGQVRLGPGATLTRGNLDPGQLGPGPRVLERTECRARGPLHPKAQASARSGSGAANREFREPPAPSRGASGAANMAPAPPLQRRPRQASPAPASLLSHPTDGCRRTWRRRPKAGVSFGKSLARR